MGWFSAWNDMSTYEAELKTYGINPYSLPADLHSRVCSYTAQSYERRLKSLSILGIPKEYLFQCSAALVALCVLGPTPYSRDEQRGFVSMDEDVADAAAAWKKGGPDSSLNAKIIQTVSDAGVMNSEFGSAFNAMLKGT